MPLQSPLYQQRDAVSIRHHHRRYNLHILLPSRHVSLTLTFPRHQIMGHRTHNQRILGPSYSAIRLRNTNIRRYIQILRRTTRTYKNEQQQIRVP